MQTALKSAADVPNDGPPKVFDDFMKYCKENTAISVYLPTPVFFYSFALGQVGAF